VHSDIWPVAFDYRGRNPEKCIVPQYCINKAAATTIERPKGHGSEKDRAQGDKSLARLWWDEIFTTCIGRMMIHSHRNMHPGQFRSFSAREYARAQGFPDWYKICGSALHYCNKRYDNPDTLVPLNKFQQIGACAPSLSVAIVFNPFEMDRFRVAALLS
jgi:site-specific DNA-cytosine methylase